jgi:16S rRNA (cytosine967-C5)-methyltransferase
VYLCALCGYELRTLETPRNFSSHRIFRHTGGLKKKNQNSKATASPARATAFDILLRVERESAYASELLHSRACEKLSPPDHALATELVMGVLRWRSKLDDEIAQASSQKLAKFDIEVLIALRLGLYQLLWLDRIPQHAAIHESVELVKRARKTSATSFVNAILRKLSSRAGSEPKITEAERDANLISAEAIARTFAHPPWMVERWVREYGFAITRHICRHDQTIPATAIRLRDSLAQDTLRAQGIELAPGALLATARRVLHGDIVKTDAFRTGQIVIQDEASQLVAALVGGGTKILDCCAAPGGKTLAMADGSPSATIAATELHPHRARLLKKLLVPKSSAGNQSRANISIVTADARAMPYTGNFDRVLADVPCSGTGTLARNPEIKWRIQPSDLAGLQVRQRAILASAMQQVAPGGRLIYSTCSLEKEENEDVIEHALQNIKSFRLIECRRELDSLKSEGKLTWPEIASLTGGPYLRTLPGIHPCDGFFAAILERA